MVRLNPPRRPIPGWLLILAYGLIWNGTWGAAVALEPALKPQFLRIQRDESKTPISLDTSVVTYRPRKVNNQDATGQSLEVALIGAVHVGEPSYYRELNRRFRDYDAVLYELVAPPDAKIPQPGQRSGHPVSLLQVTMKNALDLEFQLDRVDYKQANFVHADLSPEEFSKSMEARGESFTKLMFRMMGQGVAQQSSDPARSNDMALLSALFSKNRSRDLKRVMAQQFEEMEKANVVLDGPNGSTILTERNLRVVKVLEQQISAGKKRLAIFYGAAHLPDLDRRLRTQFGVEPVEEVWLEAWNLRVAAK